MGFLPYLRLNSRNIFSQRWVFAQVSHKAVIAYLTSNSFFTLSHSLCVHLVLLLLACVCWMSLLASSDFVLSPMSCKLLSLSPPLCCQSFFTFHGCDLPFQAECPFPLKIPLRLLNRSTEAKDESNEGSASASFLKSAVLYELDKHYSSSYQAAGRPGGAAPCSCAIWTLSGTKAHGTGGTRHPRTGLQLRRMQKTR